MQLNQSMAVLVEAEGEKGGERESCTLMVCHVYIGD